MGEFILQFHTKIYQNFLSSFQLDQNQVLRQINIFQVKSQFTWSTDNVGSQVLGPPKINKQQLKKFEYKICKKLKGV